MTVTVNGNIAGGGVVGTVSTTSGGTGITGYTSGDILYASATDTLSKLAKGADGEVLTLASGVPDWAAVSASGDVTGPASSTDNAVARFDLTTGKIIQDSGITIADGATGTLAGSNSGDVTLNASVADILGLTGQELTADDPAADRILFWDDSAGKLAHLTAGSGLTITDTTITAAGGGITNLGETSLVGVATSSITGIASTAEIIYVSILYVSVDTSNATPILVQLGDAGGLENTTYDSSITYLLAAGITTANVTSGVPLDTNAGPAATYTGDITFKKIAGNEWEYSGILRDGSNVFRLISGVKTTSAAVDRVGLVAAAGLFDGASSFAVSYL